MERKQQLTSITSTSTSGPGSEDSKYNSQEIESKSPHHSNIREVDSTLVQSKHIYPNTPFSGDEEQNVIEIVDSPSPKNEDMINKDNLTATKADFPQSKKKESINSSRSSILPPLPKRSTDIKIDDNSSTAIAKYSDNLELAIVPSDKNEADVFDKNTVAEGLPKNLNIAVKNLPSLIIKDIFR